MIYYATIHWKTDRWIDIQLKMLSKYTGAPYKVYAFLNGVDQVHASKFDVVLDSPDRDHARKLDILAQRIQQDARPEDWIIFIDGDAFPIAPVFLSLSGLLDEYPLVAVQRLENLGEKQPHPSFCATTSKFWKEIRGTWSKGHTWINAMGNPDTDVGGDLLGLLDKHGANWLPLHRTNTVDRHPLLFGIYANLIYHHGAGFRKGAGRQAYYNAGIYKIYKRIDARILNNIVPRKYLSKMRRSIIHPEGRRKRRIYKAIEPIEREIFSLIQANPDAVRKFAQLPD